jgi:hypothetical protein
MRGAVTGEWSMAGDRCPRCGGTDTAIWSFFELRRQGIKLRSRARRRGGHLGYKIQCRGCGAEEAKPGLPGREVSEDIAAEPGAAADPRRQSGSGG